MYGFLVVASFLAGSGDSRCCQCFPPAILETLASVTRSNPAGNALQHSDVVVLCREDWHKATY